MRLRSLLGANFLVCLTQVSEVQADLPPYIHTFKATHEAATSLSNFHDLKPLPTNRHRYAGASSARGSVPAEASDDDGSGSQEDEGTEQDGLSGLDPVSGSLGGHFKT